MRLLVACGLRREAKLIGSRWVEAVAGGGDAARLEALLEAAVARERPRFVLSSGIAGALDPGLRIGEVVIDGDDTPLRWLSAALRLASIEYCAPVRNPGSEIPGEGIPRETDSARRVDDVKASWDCVLGGDTMLVTAAEKAALRARTGAATIDMESHVAARVAFRHGLPYVALRIVSDTADEDLPPAVLVGMKPDGGMALGAVLASLARHPAQLPALIRTGRHAGIAFRQLGRVHHMLARAGIGRFDLGELALDMR